MSDEAEQPEQPEQPAEDGQESASAVDAEGLTDRQVIALSAILAGHPMSEAARRTNVTRQTVSRWVNHDAAFRRALRERRAVLRHALLNRLLNAADDAAKALHDIVKDTEAPAAARVGAAARILSGVGVDELGELDAVEEAGVAKSMAEFLNAEDSEVR
ncbi:MAG TPA: helix-turn-helix domain-containing protein [Reyranella sp.]|nr:helix-turn-helix domain-containing protein [Reyranella sp.]